MAKLEIKLKDEAKKRQQEKEYFQSAGLSIKDYDILIDGNEPSHLLGVELSLDSREINYAEIRFGVDDLHIDASALTLLKGEVELEETDEEDDWKTFDYK